MVGDVGGGGGGTPSTCCPWYIFKASYFETGLLNCFALLNRNGVYC